MEKPELTFWPTQYVVRNCRCPSLRLCDLETQEEPGKVISGAFKGQGFMEQIQKEGTPRINLERINGFSNIEEKWIGSERGVNITCKASFSAWRRASLLSFSWEQKLQGWPHCLPRGDSSPKDIPHQPCQDCKGLHLPPLKYLHQLAFTLRETISKLIIWIFSPLLLFSTLLCLD